MLDSTMLTLIGYFTMLFCTNGNLNMLMENICFISRRYCQFLLQNTVNYMQ